MKRTSKRAILILLIAMLALSMTPLMPAHAVTVDYFEDEDGFVVTSGSKGDEIHVFGMGVTAGVDVNLYWDAVKAWDGEKGLLNHTEAEASGAYEVWFDVPEAIGGTHYLWVKDTDTGDTASRAFDVDTKISLSPSSGLIGDKITIKGYGYDEEKDVVEIRWDYAGYAPILTTTPATPETNDLGSWTATFKVPTGYAYGPWVVYARDESLNEDDATFTIGASISFDVEEGPVGTIVEVDGRGFQPGQTISYGEVWLVDGVTNINCYVFDAPITVQSDGDISLELVIPQVSKDEEGYDIFVTDGVRTADEEFEVLGLAEIEVEPEYGVQGVKVTVSGYNFTQKSGEDVLIELWDVYPTGTKEADIKELETDSNGEFTGSITVPAVSSGNYDLVAIMETAYNIDADTAFRVGMIIVIVSPTSGPSGSKVTMTGTGFTPNQEWNATFGDLVLIEDGDVDGDGDLLLEGEVPTFFVPTVDPGSYVIVVLDIDTEIEVDVEWEVTERTNVWTDPEMAPNEYNLTIEGLYFSEEDDVDLEFLLYNVTADGEVDDEWDLTGDVEYGGVAVVTNEENGNFTGYWEILDDDELSLGDYWINVTDDNDLWAKGMFSIVEKTVDIDARKDSFAIGDTVAFNIESSFKQVDSYIEVMTPDGELYWQMDTLVDDLWIKVGTIHRVPYYQQTAGGNPMVLEDVPLGTWSWTWYDEDDEEIDSGTFTVSEAPADILAQQMTTLTEDFAGLTEDFSSLSEDFAGLSTDVAGLAADVSAAAAAAQAANAAVSNLADVVGDIADIANSAKTSADSARTAAESAQTAAEDAGRAASGLTTLVYGAIGASLVAALAAIVSLMQISRRIAG